MAPTPPDLTKLTVPQLRALCKERRMTGYSKLAKAALLQRLAEVPVPSSVVATSNAASVRAPSVTVTHPDAAPNLAAIDRRGRGEVVHQAQAVQPSAATEFRTVKAPLPTRLPKPQNPIVTDTREIPTKRTACIDTSAPSKRPKLAISARPELPPVPTAALQEGLPAPVDSSVFKVSKVPARPPQISAPTLPNPLAAVNRPVVSQQIITAGRFKPLVPSTPKPCDQANRNETGLSITGLDSTSRTVPLPVLSNISFPPRASERKWVYRWAIILSALSPADRQTCTLVSRTFRYAVYLSATHILYKNYSGRRLDTLFQQHPKNMTNFWPYLRLRMAEVSRQRHAFKQSFLGRYTDSLGYDPLSAHLWTSPDDTKQVRIALRFVLTRMWFAVSVGAYGHDASTWSQTTILEVKEVVQGEIWQVTARHDRTGETNSFYVLEATCEVIGQSLQGQNTLGYCLRADWTAWIVERSRATLGEGRCSLLDYVKWSNSEDYYQGVSKAWLCRVQGQDADSVAKRNVAKRYVLASVVANGISGQWMTTSAMAQEFAGFPGTCNPPQTTGRSTNTVNMYLAAHHHIESVHFTTSRGEVLHAAVAVVQTPGREYYVLRDNGMQVGCEEEGIPKVWQWILGCDLLGRAR